MSKYVDKPCTNCGEIMYHVTKNRRFCHKCVMVRYKEREAERAIRRKLAKEVEKFEQAKETAQKAKIKPLAVCMNEAKAMGISYGEYVLRGLDKGESNDSRNTMQNETRSTF